jgi:polar amino acid transport system substrate-binding protein
MTRLRLVAAAAAALVLVLVVLSPRASWAQTSDTTSSTSSTTGGPGAADLPVVRVATKDLKPFVYIDDLPLRGFSIDYWNEVAERIGVRTEWVEQGSVGEILESTRTGAVDAAIAGISITKEREEVIDFSQPYYQSGHQIVVRQAGNGEVLKAMGRLVASREFLFPLLGLALLVVAVSHLVWYFERGHESDDFPYEYRAGIGEALWWSTVNVVTGGEAVKNINTAVSRLIALLWMLVGLLLLAYITARATSILTVAELQSDVSGLGDLSGKRVSTKEGTESVAFLKNEAGIAAIESPTLEDALNDLVAGRTDAVVFDSGVVANAVHNSYRTQLKLVEPPIGRDPYGIAVPAGSPWRERIDGAVIEIGRDGTLDRLEDRWFGTS